MEGLIFLVILIPVVFLILLLTILNRSGENRKLLEELYDQVRQLRQQVADGSGEKKKESTSVASLPKEETIQPVEPSPPAKQVLPVESLDVSPQSQKTMPSLQSETRAIEQEKESIAQEVTNPGMPGSTTRDLEKFIGENLVSKIGIAVLVLGIAFFIKYAIDKNWVHESGRVIIGLLSGGFLIGLAHYFRNTYRSFSSVLVGGGLSVLYFSIAFAFHQYHLIGQTTAFILMVIISAGGVLLSIFYNRQELAILAAIGGFITPFLVNTGQDNYIALFTYLGILNAGLMVLAWFKRWPSINIIALFFTTIVFAGWLIKRIVLDDPGPLPYRNAVGFATLFYLLFVIMNIINCIRLRNTFNAFDFIILLTTNFLYYAAGMIILTHWGIGHTGLFTATLGVFNGLMAIVFHREKSVDRNFVALLMGLALTFISLSAAIRFEANYVILFWAAESVILFWLYQRTSLAIMRWASGLLIVLMMGGLLLNWSNVYFDDPVPVLVNKGFITAILAAAALFFLYFLTWRNSTQPPEEPAFKNNILVIASGIAYAAGALEIIYQFSRFYPDTAVYIIYLQLFTFVVVLLLMTILKRSLQLSRLLNALPIVCYGFFLITIAPVMQVSQELLIVKKGMLFSAHWLSAILLTILLYKMTRQRFSTVTPDSLEDHSFFTWVIAASFILLFSVGLYHVMLWLNFDHPADWPWWRNLYYKAGLSMLWGLCSFTLMWLGMKKNFRTLRIISLSVFTITLVKLFVYDIRNIPPGGKIIAFILLGILLLAVSFMYQRLRKIIIDNLPENNG